MRAAVIGAGGHVGNAIVRELLSRGCRVTACGRRPSAPANLDGLAVSYQTGDANSREQLERWISGQDLVVDAAAPYPLQLLPLDGAAETQMIAAAERRTRSLIGVVRRSHARLLYVGSFVTITTPRAALSVWRSRFSRVIHPYFVVKDLMESLIIDACRRDLEAVILNPTACFGPWDSRPPDHCLIPRVLRASVLPASTDIINVVDVREVASAAIAALEAGIFGEPILVAGESICARDLFALICELGGRQPPNFTIPSVMSVIGSLSLETILGLFGQQTPIPSILPLLAGEFGNLPIAIRQFELGVENRPLSSTIADAIKWYHRLGYC